MSRYPDNYKCAAIIPLLDLAQRQHGGWLPLAAMDKVARIVKTAPIRVYEVASFYTMFNRERVGKYFIQLCGTTPCMVCGSEEIKHTIEQHLGIQEGETPEDGLFTLREVECLGACVNAPMVQINDDCYESLTPESTIQILESCKQGKIVPVGKWGSKPMNGQVSCEGPLGKTSLLEKRPKPGAFMRKDLEVCDFLRESLSSLFLFHSWHIHRPRWTLPPSSRKWAMTSTSRRAGGTPSTKSCSRPEFREREQQQQQQALAF